MNENEIDDQELAKWDPGFIKQFGNVIAPVSQAMVPGRGKGAGEHSARRRRIDGFESLRRRADT